MFVDVRKNGEYESLVDIVSNERIQTVFQGIFNLGTGEVYAYEALSRITGPSPFPGPEALFQAAQAYQMTSRLEKLCRKHALTNAHRLGMDVPVTLNVCPSVLKCPEHEKGLTISLIEELFDVRNKVILELTERFYIRDTRLFRKTADYYRRQGFRIAIDDLGAGFAGLNMLIQTEPFMVKLDRILISNIDKFPKKRMLLESMISFCHKINSIVVAEGIETEKELDVLAAMKVDLGQGYFLARPQADLEACSPEAQSRILQISQHSSSDKSTSNCVESLMLNMEPVSFHETVAEVAERFNLDKVLTCLPVTDQNVPVGIIHKNRLYYKLGQRFGYDLFSGKTVESVLEPVLTFESGTPLEDVSQSVLNRDERSVYDAIIVVHDGVYLGVVKIHHLLERITEQKINMARQANPLSGLPGNNMIKEEIEYRLATHQIFAVTYFDLDHFKPFNDNFGFDQGDQVIRFFGTLLKKVLSHWDMKSFVGHVGGDDFVAVCRSQNIEKLCMSLTEQFDNDIKCFHDPETAERGYYQSRDRAGHLRQFPLLSLSIAVVTTCKRRFRTYGHLVSVASEVKKKVKTLPGSNYLIDQRSGS